MTGSLSVPPTLAAAVGEGGDADRRRWLDELPRTVGWLATRWSLRVGRPFLPGGQTAWVAPARGPDGEERVLKVGWRHAEAEHEPEGLRWWDGDGVVRVAASERTADSIGLLLERCVPGTALAARPEPEQDLVIAELLVRPRREPEPGHPFRPLQQMCDAWADELEARDRARRPVLDPGLVRDGVALFRELPRTAPRSVLLFTDLHAGNVLAAERSPWLAIDPKPYVGDPAYDALQHLLCCRQRLASDPEGLVRRLADLLHLDAERLRQWLFARCVIGSIDRPELAHVAARIRP